MIDAAATVQRQAWRDGTPTAGVRCLAEETAVAITYNRVTHAVMMATPSDLHDFAVGFSLSEEIVPSAAEIEDFTVVEAEGGIELRLWIAAGHMAALERRRRRLAGATGCGRWPRGHAAAPSRPRRSSGPPPAWPRHRP